MGRSGKPLYPLLEMVRARILEFIRDPGAVFWVFVFPVLLAVGLGIAFRNRGPEKVQVAVIGEGKAAAMKAFGTAEGVEFLLYEEADGLQALRSSKVDLLIRLDVSTNPPGVTYRYDPGRPEALQTRTTVDDAVQRAFGRVDVVAVREEKVEEKGGRYIDFLLPGLLGLNIMSSGMWGIGYAVVDSRKRKLLKRFAATPMNRAHFLLSFMISRLVFLISEVAVLVFFGWLIFDVQVYGSLFSVLIISILGAFTFSGLALLVATRTESTEVAAGLLQFIMLPMWVLSGCFFSYARFPEVFHPIIRALPLTAINDSLRLIMNDGGSIFSAWLELGVMAFWGLLSFVVAMRLFKWQ